MIVIYAKETREEVLDSARIEDQHFVGETSPRACWVVDAGEHQLCLAEFAGLDIWKVVLTPGVFGWLDLHAVISIKSTWDLFENIYSIV